MTTINHCPQIRSVLAKLSFYENKSNDVLCHKLIGRRSRSIFNLRNYHDLIIDLVRVLSDKIKTSHAFQKHECGVCTSTDDTGHINWGNNITTRYLWTGSKSQAFEGLPLISHLNFKTDGLLKSP